MDEAIEHLNVRRKDIVPGYGEEWSYVRTNVLSVGWDSDTEE